MFTQAKILAVFTLFPTVPMLSHLFQDRIKFSFSKQKNVSLIHLFSTKIYVGEGKEWNRGGIKAGVKLADLRWAS